MRQLTSRPSFPGSIVITRTDDRVIQCTFNKEIVNLNFEKNTNFSVTKISKNNKTKLGVRTAALPNVNNQKLFGYERLVKLTKKDDRICNFMQQ